jgi:hypothetical protein
VKWYPVSLPNSVRAFSPNVGPRKYSQDQILVALLTWFAAKSLEQRVELVQAYRDRSLTSDPVAEGGKECHTLKG